MTRKALSALVAVLLGTSTGAVLVPAPAQAVSCAKGEGVTVVVDPHQLGGGVTTRCVDAGGSKAAAAFAAAGVSLQRASRQPGFVCRVQAKPADAGCVQASPADAYWSLWVSTGDGSWSYASIGVDGLSVPKGGWVAFSWQGQSGRAQPGVTPVGAAAPKPAAPPATGSSAGGSGGSSADAAPGGSAAADPAAEAEEKAAEQRKAEKAEETERAKKAAARRAAASASPSATASAPGETAEARATSASSTSSAPWGTVVGIVAVLVLLAAAGVLAWRRRSSAP